MPFVERRGPISQTAVTVAIMFGAAMIVAIAFDRVPVWRKHGPDSGPGLVSRQSDARMYYALNGAYAATCFTASFIALYRFPWVAIRHIRLLLLVAVVLLLLLPIRLFAGE